MAKNTHLFALALIAVCLCVASAANLSPRELRNPKQSFIARLQATAAKESRVFVAAKQISADGVTDEVAYRIQTEMPPLIVDFNKDVADLKTLMRALGGPAACIRDADINRARKDTYAKLAPELPGVREAVPVLEELLAEQMGNDWTLFRSNARELLAWLSQK